MQTIREDCKSGNFKPVYLLYGEEPYLKQQAREMLRKAIAGTDTLNVTTFDGREYTFPDFMGMAETLPFMAPRRLILINDSGLFKKDSGELPEYLVRMPETTYVVFTEEEIDKRSKLFKRVNSIGYAAECGRLKDRELMLWAARRLAASGKKIREADLSLFLEKTGDDMENVRQELDKLCSYVGNREAVTREDIETITSVQITGRIFVMIDAVAAGDIRRALDLYYDLLRLKEPAMKILVLLTRQFHLLLQVRELQQKGAGRDQIASACHLQSFVAGRYMSQAASFTQEQLLGAIRKAMELDAAIKSGNLRDNLAVEILMVSLCERKEVHR